MSDYNLIVCKYEQRSTNHAFSEKSKNPRLLAPKPPSLQVGDIVYLISGKDKSCPRDHYFSVSTESSPHLGALRRFTTEGDLKVKLSKCYAVPPSVIVFDRSGPQASQDHDDKLSPVTSAVSPASVSPESPPPAPPELTSVPSDEEQFPFSTCDDTTLDAATGVPPLPVLQEEPNTSVTPQIKPCHPIPVRLLRLLVQDLKDSESQFRS